MKLTNVLVATDMNPLYYKFIPIFIKTWNKLFPNVKVTIVVVAKELVDELLPYKDNIVLFPPIENMNTAFIAQNIRLLYPALIDTEGGVLITDMDMLPMSRKYYTEQIKNIDNTKFVCYRPLSCVGKNEMVMCYNIALPNIWRDIFNINTTNDIIDTLQYIYKNNYYAGTHGGAGWNIDQLYLYNKTQKWNERTKSLIILNKPIYVILNNYVPSNMYVRLWKHYNFNDIAACLKQDNIVDFHMPRPYFNYKTDINRIVNLII